MKAISLKDIKQELNHLSPNDLQEICLRLSRFKKENKELLSYLLFHSSDEQAYVESIKRLMDDGFATINRNSFFYIRKSIRKILTQTKKHIRYSQKKKPK
jgi:hypothetical protein